ncbi:MAG: phenylalanine--tRNA ligase subunit beta [Actinomycetes bacterium]
MKLPLSWLRSFVDLDDLSVDELVDLMSLNGLEVEEVHHPGAGTRGVRVKRVVEWGPHPDADKLRTVTVTDGTDEVGLVCGAANFDVGDVVAHAEVGASIPPQEPGGEPFVLAARELRGVVSNGMLCSARELGLGDDHSGIMVLPADTPLGVDLTEVLPVGEPVIEVAVLADRGDHHSLLGVAREVAAILGRELRVPEVPALPAPTDPVPTTIAPDAGCSRFVTRVVEGVTNGPSPWWLRQRLAQCGVRSISLVVDVTNYVMLELGQPLHAFDLDRLAGPSLHVRTAAGGERFTTLDDVERTLEPGDLVIDDADGPVSLAGVMGGASTEVGVDTTRVLLEGAVWDPTAIRATSRRLGLVSEASLRFERRVDPAGADRAVARAAQLLVELGGGTAGGVGVTDHPDPVPALAPHASILHDPAGAARLLGLDDLDGPAQAALLERLGCTVTPLRDGGSDGAGMLDVVPPTWRGDLGRPIDLVEEVARLHGYAAIPATLPVVQQRGGLTPVQRALREVRALARAGGLHETMTRPFVGERALVGTWPSDGRVLLENPLAANAAAMAPSLVEGLLTAVRRNVGQGRPGAALFEVARVFRPAGDPVEAALDGAPGWEWTTPTGERLPTQPRVLGLVAQGLRLGADWLDGDDAWSVYDLLAVLDDVAALLAPADDDTARLVRRPVEREGFHPGRSAVLELRGVEVGFVGQLHPAEAEERDLPEPVVVAELLLDPLLAPTAAGLPLTRARTLTTHPAMSIDVALVADDDVSYDVLAGAVAAGAGDLLDGLRVFDVYRGEQVGEGRRSVAIALRLQDPGRQLTDADAQEVLQRIEDEARAVGATLRR